jgi:hypothetical protein
MDGLETRSGSMMQRWYTGCDTRMLTSEWTAHGSERAADERAVSVCPIGGCARWCAQVRAGPHLASECASVRTRVRARACARAGERIQLWGSVRRACVHSRAGEGRAPCGARCVRANVGGACMCMPACMCVCACVRVRACLSAYVRACQ